jgi:hypothetical protein
MNEYIEYKVKRNGESLASFVGIDSAKEYMNLVYNDERRSKKSFVVSVHDNTDDSKIIVKKEYKGES